MFASKAHQIWYTILRTFLLLANLLFFLPLSKAEIGKPFIDTLPFPLTNGSMLGSLATDSRDMLWLSTFGGYIHRYDGAGNSSELNTTLFDLRLDPWDRLWSERVFQNEFHLGFIDLKSGQNVIIKPEFASGQSIGLAKNFSITHDDKNLWLITIQGNLYRATLTSNIPHSLTFHKESTVNIHTKQFAFDNKELWVDSDGNVWFALKKQLLRYTPEKKIWTDFSSHLASDARFDWGIFSAISKNGTTWLSCQTSNQLLRITRNDKVSSIDIPYRIMDLQADKARNTIWIATTNGLYFVADEHKTPQHYEPEIWQDAGIPSPTIRKLSLDRFGNLWFTSSKGVHVMRTMHSNVKRIIPIISRYKKPLDAGLQLVMHMTKQNEQILWWVNRRQELIRYDQSNGHEEVFPIQFNEKNHFDEVRSIALIEQNIFLTTHSGNVLRFNINTKHFLPAISTNLTGGNEGNSNNFIRSDDQSSGKYWLAGYSDTELHPNSNSTVIQRQFRYWDVPSGKFETFNCVIENPELNSLLKSTNLHFMTQYQETLWVLPHSSISNIIFKISLRDHQCTNLQLPFESDLAYAALQNDNETLWLIQGRHVRRINIHRKQILYDQIIPLSSVDFVAVDNQSNFLVYGDGSLWRFATTTHTWQPLFASEINLDVKSGIKPFFDQNTNIFYILSHQGILAIDAKNPPILGNPRLVFTSIKIGLEKQTLFEKLPDLKIPFGDSIEISYVAVPVVPSKLLRFRYRLAPDQPWIDLNNNTKLIFTRLPPGNVSLEMQAAFTHQDFGKSEYFTFSILPPWWRTYSAYAAYTFIFALLLKSLIDWQRAKERLRHANLTVSVFENTTEGLCVLSKDYQVLRINYAMQIMLGWNQGQSVAEHLQKMISLTTAQNIREIASSLTQLKHWQGEANLLSSSGIELVADIRVERLDDQNVSGNLLLVAEDITARKHHENQLLYLSRHDTLTQLPNRLLFSEHLASLLAHQTETDRYALILIDLDDFKNVNDSLGHLAGDQLLQEVAKDLLHLSLSTPQPGRSLVARHSGDEFIMIVEAPKNLNLMFEHWLQTTLSTLNRRRIINGSEINTSASFGISFLPDNSLDPTVLLQQADMAMYQAKRQHKGQYAYYSNQMDIELSHRLEIENAILHNQGHFGLEVYYQPKIFIATSRCVGIEALSRWRLASGELLNPGQFLSLIREGQMTRLFNLAVIRQACENLIKFQAVQPELKMSINVSPNHLEDPNYVDQICAIVDEFAIPHPRIILEILEDAGISNPKVLNNIQLIRERQFSISIDDFGTGYSSLSHLNKLLAEELKIDRSFLEGIPNDPAAEKLFSNIVELGKRFEMSIICEGVETKEQLEFIHANGCQYYQGYYFSHPVAAEQLLTLLVENSVRTS